MKKLLSILCIISIIFSLPILTVNGISTYNLSLLSNCKNIYTYSSDNSSYIFGYNSDTLYSAKVLPRYNIRYITVEGLIRSVCHNDTYAYALYEDSRINDNYYVVQMNMNNGNCTYFNMGKYSKLNYNYLAVADSEIFLINSDSHYSYVMGLDFNGAKLYEYCFSSVVSNVFINNGKAYALLYSGEIYNIGKGSYCYVTTVNSEAKICNAGNDCIFTNNETLVSLKNNSQQKVYGANLNCVVNNNQIIYADGNKLRTADGKFYNTSYNIIALTSTGDNIALLLSDYTCKIIAKSELNTSINRLNIDSNSSNSSLYCLSDDEIIYAVESGTTVSQFKNNYSASASVYDSDGNLITSGKIKTGYSVIASDVRYYISVRGDVTGEGNVKSNDIALLMSVLVGETELGGAYYKSADYNYDGYVNNKDLVLIAQKYEQQK